MTTYYKCYERQQTVFNVTQNLDTKENSNLFGMIQRIKYLCLIRYLVPYKYMATQRLECVFTDKTYTL